MQDLYTNNSDDIYMHRMYGIKQFTNKTNHNTGDDITLVIDDIIFK